MKIHHIGYIVKNIEKAQQPFIALGFEVSKETMRDETRKADICFLKNDGYCVELIAPYEGSDLENLLKKYPNMPYHMCYVCDDIGKAVEYYKSKRFLLFKDIAPAPAIGTHAKVAFMINANIGIIELVEE